MQTLIGNVLFSGQAYENPDPTQITLTLPDILPNRSAACFVGEPITDLPSLDTSPEVRVRITPGEFHNLPLAYAPDTLQAVADELERTLRGAPTEQIGFKAARVSLLGDRLVIAPGGLSGEVTVRPTGGNAANILGLRNGANRIGYISGQMEPFPTLSSPTPTVEVQMDGQTFDAALSTLPQTIEEAAEGLQTAIQAGPTAAFHDTEVVFLGHQLLILTGGDTPIVFAPSGSDETTVGELQLRRDYALRVRVSGAESLGDVTSIELPL
jgi:hypothetical protein